MITSARISNQKRTVKDRRYDEVVGYKSKYEVCL
jgi:hypothetical protein